MKFSFAHRQPIVAAPPARRLLPPPGKRLTLANVKGQWRPSGAVGGVGVFAVVWSTRSGEFWAALHDFEAIDVLRLLEECRRLDQEARLSAYATESLR